jgi:hypothetical protein
MPYKSVNYVTGGGPVLDYQAKLDQAVMLLTSIQEVLGSNLNGKTNYSDWSSSHLSSVSPKNSGNKTLTGHDHFLPHSFQLFFHCP